MSKREIDLSSSEPDEASDEDEYVEHNRSQKNKRGSRTPGGVKKAKRRRKNEENASHDTVNLGLTVKIPKKRSDKVEEKSKDNELGHSGLKLKSGVGLGFKLRLGPTGRMIPLKNLNANSPGLDSEGQRMYDAMNTLKILEDSPFDDFILDGGSSKLPEDVREPQNSETPERVHQEHAKAHPLTEAPEHEFLQGLLEARDSVLKESVESTYSGQKLRPLTVKESRSVANQFQASDTNVNISSSSSTNSTSSSLSRLLHRKFEVEKYKRIRGINTQTNSLSYLPKSQLPNTLKKLEPPDVSVTPAPGVLDALYAVQTTPYANSFASRLAGSSFVISNNEVENGNCKYRRTYLHRDWEGQSPWMDLMDDIHEHHSLMHPEREQSSRPMAPIDYQSLRKEHLPQVHDILTRTFWPGIDVSDSLQYSPEQCTVVATYRRLVVGVALLSSPQETYITYLAVRAGWEKSHIATKMLYSLIIRNPRKDIILHVSANNPAMLLYNRFGFKAEEFIVGFYEDYLDSNSRASKNAFRLRLRA